MDGRMASIKMTHKLGLAVAAALLSLAVSPVAAANAAGPELAITSPPSGSTTNSLTVSFSGTTTDASLSDPVRLTINRSHGGPITAETLPNGESWAIESVALPEGDAYTAVVEQTNELFETGGSSPVSFTVNTKPPTVTLQQPASPSKNTEPKFSGTASESASVVVHVLNSEGHELAKASGTPKSGSWTSGPTSPALASGSYSAFATEASSIGNGPGTSETVAFVVNTNPPTVTLDQPLKNSNNATPTFTGTASDTTLVTVKVYLKGTSTLEATVTALPTAGAWESGRAALPSGKHSYTAVASQESSLENPTGTSAPVSFSVDTEAPSVVLNPPASPTNDATPSFSGSASEANPVSVKIYAGPTISGNPVATATATGTGGGWTSGPVSPALPDGEYVAVATQESSFGHEPGGAGPDRFVVDTVAPQVSLAHPLNGSSSSGGTEAVDGGAGTVAGDSPDSTHVTVELFAGTQAAGAPSQSVEVPVTGGTWSVTLAGLTTGGYVVRAEQRDAAGNVGVSATSSFSVVASGAVAAGGPSASFAWSPSAPHAGEQISLLSSSTDPARPITSYSWDLLGTGAFAAGGPLNATSFSTAGKHLVQLRVSDAGGASNVAAETIDVAARRTRLMQPFPTVKIAASRSGAGIRLRLLSIRASSGARIAVSCSGKGCPAKSQSRIAAAGKAGPAPLEFRRFERFLRPGVVLEIRVSKTGEIGKYTRFTVRRNRLPSRSDACIGSATGRPIACPSS